MVIKNFWSLQVDEAIVADEIRHNLGKNYEVFFPTNSQLNDIDLIIYNLKTGKSKSVQVKSSRTYNWRDGRQHGWHIIKKDSIFHPKNKIDFFIFVWHVKKTTRKKRSIEQAFLVIPIKKFQKILGKKKVRPNNTYHFSFWSDLKETVTDANNPNHMEIDFSKYYDNFELLKF